MRKLGNHAGIVNLMIVALLIIMVASALVGMVAMNTHDAGETNSVANFPGVGQLLDVWPLLFIVVPVLFVARRAMGGG